MLALPRCTPGYGGVQKVLLCHLHVVRKQVLDEYRRTYPWMLLSEPLRL